MRSSDDLTTSARIRDAAIAQFGAHGFNTGVRAIATAAGVSLGQAVWTVAASAGVVATRSMRIALVGVLGAAGALSRYAIGTAVGVTSFPWATLAINVVGAFLLGVVLVAGPVRWDEDLVVAVGVVAHISRISRGNNESHHPTDSHKNHHPRA